MSTNKIVVKNSEEFMSDYQPVYQPLFGLFLAKSQSYSAKIGKVDFRRAEAVGDLDAAFLSPKDTEMKQIAVADGKKSFNKYFLGTQYIQSDMQDDEGNDDVIAQVLDQHNKQADRLMLFGGGTSTANIKNNGLILSTDTNHQTNASEAIADLLDLHSTVMSVVEDASSVAGEKTLLFYGTAAATRLNSLHATSPVSVRKTLQDALGAGINIASIPSEVAPAGSGVVLVNRSMTKLHYTVLPKVEDNGVNTEKKYAWWNFLMGSMMVEVLAKKGVIHQPLTF